MTKKFNSTRNVCIVRCYLDNVIEYEYSHMFCSLIENSDWIEISEEDFIFLNDNLYRLSTNKEKVFLLEKNRKDFKLTLEDIKKQLEREVIEQETRLIEAKKKTVDK